MPAHVGDRSLCQYAETIRRLYEKAVTVDDMLERIQLAAAAAAAAAATTDVDVDKHADDADASFVELGGDSLLAVQVSQGAGGGG